MKTILYATDFSENALNAFQFACEMSKKTGSELIVLHIRKIPIIMRDTPNESAIEGNKHHFNCLMQSDEVRTEPKIRFEERENNSTVQGIIDMVEETDADLIIMGSSKENKLREVLLGNTTFELIRKAPCPVLAIPGEAKYQGFKRIAFASDLEEKDFEAIYVLSDMARLLESEIEVVHVSDIPDYENSEKVTQFKQLLQEKVSYANLNFEFLSSKNIHERLMSYIETNHIALISMFENENKSILKKWFQGDLVKQMSVHSKIPLMSFNAKYVTSILEKKLKETVHIE